MNNYYPFGMLQPGRYWQSGDYRFGFNGMENDNEIKGLGNQQDYGMRIYDPRLSRFLSIDPLFADYPYYSSYQFAGNMPIWAVDLDGLEPYRIIPEVRNNRAHLGSNGFGSVRPTTTTQFGPTDPSRRLPPLPLTFSTGYEGAWNATKTTSSSSNANAILFELVCQFVPENGVQTKQFNIGFTKTSEDSRTIYTITGPDKVKFYQLQAAWESGLQKEIQKALIENGLDKSETKSENDKSTNNSLPFLESSFRDAVIASVRMDYTRKNGLSPWDQFLIWAKKNEKNLEKGETKVKPEIRQGD